MESIDFYKYPGEDVLVNYFDCHDAEELAMLEALSTGANLLYLQLHPIDGKSIGKDRIQPKDISILSDLLPEEEKKKILREAMTTTPWIYGVIKEVCKK